MVKNPSCEPVEDMSLASSSQLIACSGLNNQRHELRQKGCQIARTAHEARVSDWNNQQKCRASRYYIYTEELATSQSSWSKLDCSARGIRPYCCSSQQYRYLVSTQPTSDGSTRMHRYKVVFSAILEAEIHAPQVLRSPFEASRRKSPIAPRTIKPSSPLSRNTSMTSIPPYILRGLAW